MTTTEPNLTMKKEEDLVQTLTHRILGTEERILDPQETTRKRITILSKEVTMAPLLVVVNLSKPCVVCEYTRVGFA